MANYFTTFDSPSDYPGSNECYIQGDSPKLLQSFLSFVDKRIEQLEEIYLCLPYFNNALLDKSLRELSEKGIKINVICLPIPVFDKKKIQWFIDLATGKEAFDMAKTAYQLARPVFAAHFKNPSNNYQLHCFDHYSIRDANSYLIGKEEKDYSLQMNVCLMIYKKGGGAFVSSSSSWAVGSPPELNHMTIIEDDWALLKSGLRFFNQLLANSVIIHHYDFKSESQDQTIDFQEIDQQLNAHFTAPFFKDAAPKAEEKIENLIKACKNEIIIVSPQIGAYEYSFNGAYHSGYENEVIENYGILRTVLERAGAGVRVSCLSSNIQNTESTFFELFKTYPNTEFAIKENLKSSFIILDNKLLLLAGPLDSEQFIYLDEVKIKKEDKVIYQGVYSKIKHFILVEDEEAISPFRLVFERLLSGAKKIK